MSSGISVNLRQMPRCRNSKEKRKARSHARAVNFAPLDPNRRIIVRDSPSDRIVPPKIGPLTNAAELSPQIGNHAVSPPSEDEEFVLQVLAEEEE